MWLSSQSGARSIAASFYLVFGETTPAGGRRDFVKRGLRAAEPSAPERASGRPREAEPRPAGDRRRQTTTGPGGRRAGERRSRHVDRFIGGSAVQPTGVGLAIVALTCGPGTAGRHQSQGCRSARTLLDCTRNASLAGPNAWIVRRSRSDHRGAPGNLSRHFPGFNPGGVSRGRHGTLVGRARGGPRRVAGCGAPGRARRAAIGAQGSGQRMRGDGQ